MHVNLSIYLSLLTWFPTAITSAALHALNAISSSVLLVRTFNTLMPGSHLLSQALVEGTTVSQCCRIAVRNHAVAPSLSDPAAGLVLLKR